MLSILIPIYNFYTLPLVQELHNQCEKAKLEFEILCYDDGSNEHCKLKNRRIQELSFAQYLELEENFGRAGIRNLLAKDAQYSNLLFLDGDSGITNKSFIENYLKLTNLESVSYGGRHYATKKPDNTNLILHWKYGSEKEALAKAKRIKAPYLNFQTNNFLIPKFIFDQVKFDESISGYGYEDLLFAKELKKLNIPVIHVENEVYHLGLETTAEFLRKSENAIHNLSVLFKDKKIEQTRLIQMYISLNKLNLLGIINSWTAINRKRFLENLYSREPHIRNFSLLKLWLFSQYINGQEGSFDL